MRKGKGREERGKTNGQIREEREGYPINGGR